GTATDDVVTKRDATATAGGHALRRAEFECGPGVGVAVDSARIGSRLLFRIDFEQQLAEAADAEGRRSDRVAGLSPARPHFETIGERGTRDGAGMESNARSGAELENRREQPDADDPGFHGRVVVGQCE